MYQELELFEETFDSGPVWGTEGNDLPLPTLAVGDLFGHDMLPDIHWRRPPESGQVFKVVAIKHVFRETGTGPEVNHVLMVAVALDDMESRQEAAWSQAESDLEIQTRRGDFLNALVCDLANHNAPEVQDKLVQGIVSAMKIVSARGINDEAENAWEEAAMILQSDGHDLAETLRGEIQADVLRAIKQSDREVQLILWLATAGLDDWCLGEFPLAQEAFNVLDHSRRALDTAGELLTERVLSLLCSHDLSV